MIIKLYDNEDYDYPLLEIHDNYNSEFRRFLNEYRLDNDEYNIDEFIDLLEECDWFIRAIYPDVTEFF